MIVQQKNCAKSPCICQPGLPIKREAAPRRVVAKVAKLEKLAKSVEGGTTFVKVNFFLKVMISCDQLKKQREFSQVS